MPAHTPPPDSLEYKTALHEEHHLLEEVDVPIITISSTHRSQLKEHFKDSFPSGQEVVFSRAHYSMAIAVLIAAFEQNKTAWLTDPTNYVSRDDWSKVLFTQTVGQMMARNRGLKLLKDTIDTKARNKLPITDAVTQPLLYLTDNVLQPLVSLHYQAGNIVADAGRAVVQVITDPHVRPQYLDPLPNKSSPPSEGGVGGGHSGALNDIRFCVFDEATKTDFLLKADELNKTVDESHVIVTGPPVDPRIVAARDHKHPNHVDKRPLRLAVTTGGLGTNREEVKHILEQLAQFCFADNNGCAQLFLYAGTHKDFRNLYQEFANENQLQAGSLEDESAQIRIVFSNNLVEANEILIDYMFPWADGIITKPSGDMAYDAAAAGCFSLFLEPWGEWEENIQDRFTHLGIGTDLDVDSLRFELERFSKHYWEGESWFKSAIEKALNLESLYLKGAGKIVKVQQKLAHTHKHTKK